MSSASLSNLPELPVEVWEHIIGLLASRSPSTPDSDSARQDLSQCCLVCRAWVPRCRFFLFHELYLDSRRTLTSVAAFLKKSSFHADLVRTLKIRGGPGSDQSWISSIPLLLPKLPRLKDLILVSIDFTQQHPRFYQLFSIYRPERHRQWLFNLHIDQDLLRTAPSQVATLAAALNANSSIKFYPDTPFPVNAALDALAISSWRHSLRYLKDWRTEGSVEDLIPVLQRWRFPISSKWEVTIQSTVVEGITTLASQTRRIWEEIGRMLTESCATEQSFYVVKLAVESKDMLYFDLHKGLAEDLECVLNIIVSHADDVTIAYLAHILPSLHQSKIDDIDIIVKHTWSASTSTWHALDEALLGLKLNQGTVRSINVRHESHHAPPKESFPFECINGFRRQMIPKCVSASVAFWYCPDHAFGTGCGRVNDGDVDPSGLDDLDEIETDWEED